MTLTLGRSFPILIKLNLDDGVDGGFSIEDCKFVCRQLVSHGASAIILSGGFTSRTPFYLMRGDLPLTGMIQNGKTMAERLTMRLFGRILVRKYPYESNFFLSKALSIRRELEDIPLVYIGGVDSASGIHEIMESGMDLIALGRPLIHDPSFVAKLGRGEIQSSGCTRCNECVVEMDRGGVRCTLSR